MNNTARKVIPPNCLEVGLSTDETEVIINHPELTPSPDGRGGYLVFSPQQARDLANLLLRKARECKPTVGETGCSLCAMGMNSFTDPDTGNKMHARNGTVTLCSAQKVGG